MGKRYVLVTGATGFVGMAVCGELVKRGIPLRAALRSNQIQSHKAAAVEVGEINEQTHWGEALCDVDVVIHLAARVHVMHDESADPLAEFRRVNVAGTEHLARAAAAAGVRRLVYVSSIKVNGEETTGGHRYTENDPPSPQDPYGISKWEAEQALRHVARETGLEVVIVRPPLVYGAGVKGNFAQMLSVLDKGLPLPLASVRNQRSLIYIGNFVDALLQCAVHPAAAGNTYLVSDGEDVSTPDLMHQLGAAMGRPARLLPFPAWGLRLGARLLGKSQQMARLLGSLQVDSSRIRRDLGWRPSISLQQGLQATAAWYRGHRR